MNSNTLFGLFLFVLFVLAFLYTLLGKAMFGGDTEITLKDIKLLNKKIVISIMDFVKAMYNMETKKE